MIGKEHTLRSVKEASDDAALLDLLKRSPVFESEQWSLHFNLFIKRQSLSRLLYLDEIYRKIIDVPGVIIEFGVQYGATLATLVNLRGIHEPYNHSRHIFGFDTFSGFVAITDKDGNESRPGDYAVNDNYSDHLKTTLSLHEANAPISHIAKTHLVIGDISTTLPIWLEANPHAVVAMAIFDADLYKPTFDAITAIKPRLLKNSLLVFDELSAPNFPGETLAVQEALGINNLSLTKSRFQTYCSWGRYGDCD